MLERYDRAIGGALMRPTATAGRARSALFVLSLGLLPFVGLAYFPRTDPGQFVINLKAPTGTNVAITEDAVAQVEKIVREEVRPEDLEPDRVQHRLDPGFSSIYTPNSARTPRSSR